jgi:hypothetical protein
MSTVNSITVSDVSNISVTTVGTQGVAGPNTILNRSVAETTASTAGSLLVYDHGNLQWVDSQSSAAQSLTAKLYNLQFTSGGAAVTGILDEDNMGSNSNTKLATQQSIKSYVDVQNAAQAINFQGDTGGNQSVTINSEVMNILGGTGLDSVGSDDTVTFNIDSTVTTLVGSQTLTNKTLTSPVINTGDINNPDIDGGTVTGTAIDNSVIGANTAVAITGTTITATSFVIGNATITEAELEILDGATLSTTEINYLDGTTLGTVVASKVLAVDSNKDITGFRNVTLTGELDAGSLDISGDADIDGTLEADAITVNGTALAEVISDTVGAMISSNTEQGIVVTYQDADNTLDFNVDDFTISLAGDLSGSVTITDLASASLTATIVNNAVALGTDTTGNYVATIAQSNTGIDVANSGSETAAVTLGLNTEHVQDLVGAMFSSNTENGIAVTYQDADGTIDLDVDDFTVTLSGDVAGSGTVTNLADVTISTTIQANSVALGTDTTGNYVATISAGEGIDVSGSGSESAGVTISAEDATASNKGIASFDSTDFAVSSGAVTIVPERIQDLVGAMLSSNTESGITVTYEDGDGTIDFNVSDPTIALSGDVVGSATMTDLGNVTISTTIQANSVALGTDTTGNYLLDISAGEGIDVSHTQGEGSTATISVEDATETNKGIATFDGTDFTVSSGDVTINAERVQDIVGGMLSSNTESGLSLTYQDSDGTIDANVDDFTITLAGDLGGSVTITDLASGTLTATIQANSVALGTDTTGNYVSTISGTANEIEVSGSGSETATVTIGLPDDVTIGGDLTVTGDFTINGTTTTVNTANLDIEDSTVRFAKNATTLSATNGAGLEFGGSSSKPTILWNNSSGRLVANKVVEATSFVGDVAGNATTATTLANARTIALSGDVVASATSFDGSGNITLSTTIQANSVALGTDTTGNYVATIADSGGGTITVANSGSESAAVTLDVTDASIANNHIANNAVTLGTQTTGNYVATISGTSNEVDVSGSGSETAGVTIGLPASVDITTDLSVSNVDIATGSIVLKNSGSQSKIDFYCEVSNAHYTRLQSAAHSAYSGNVTITLPTTTGNLIGTGDTGTITNGMLAGSIANNKLANNTVAFGGISLALGATDATPAFNLTDATNYPTSSLVGTITNAQLAGSIANSKLANSTITVGDGSNTTAIALGGSVTFSAGEGIDVTESSGTITIAGEEATSSNKGVASFDATDFSVSSGAVTLQAERIQDIVGAMVSSNTESGIAVTYEDSDGTLDFNVADPVITIDGDVDGSATMTNLGDTTITVALDNTGVSAGSYGTATAVPAITVDAKGRITALSTNSISTSFTLAADSGSNDTFNTGDTLTIAGTTNEIETAVTNNQIQIGLPTAITVTTVNATNVNTTNLTIGSAAITEAELEILDGASVTTAELNILDGATVTTAELNLLDGGTSATSTTLANADRVIVNDNGTMKQVSLSDLAVYMGDNVTINQTQTALTVSGNGSFGGTLTVTGMTTLNGGLTMDTNKFTVADTSGNTSIGGTLGVTGATTLSSTLGVSGAVTASDSLAVTNDLTVNTNVLKVDTTNNRVGIKTATPSYSLDAGSATDAFFVPKGTTAQRPSGAAGLFRYNSTLSRFEGYTDAWGEIGGGGANTFTTDNFTTGNNSTTAFTLSQVPNSEDNLQVFVGGVFQNPNDYTLNGSTLTLDEAPPSGTRLVVYSVRSAVSGSNLNHDQFTASGSATFGLSIAPVSENNTMAYIDGVYQQKTDYAVSGQNLVFDTAPTSGAIVEVMTFTQTDINVPVDDTISTVKLQNGAVTTAKIAADAVDGTKIADDAVDSEHLAADSIDAEHLNANIISALTEVTPVSGDKMMILDATDSALKKADVNEIMATAVSITSSADAVAMTFDSSENASFSGDISLADNKKIKVGASDDLQIYHDSLNSYIDDAGTGGLIVRADNFYVRKAGSVENMIVASADGAVTLYHDDSPVAMTTAGGFSTATGMNLIVGDGAHLTMGDDQEIRLGDSTDIKIKHHNSGYGHFENTGTLYVDAEQIILRTDNSSIGNALTLDASHNATFAGTISSGAITASGQLLVDTDTEHQIKIDASSSSGASMHLNSAGGYAYTVYQNSSRIWRLGAYGGSDFIIRDHTGSSNALTINSSSNATFAGTVTANVSRTSSSSAVVLTLKDNVTGLQTNGVYKAIRSESNGTNSVSEIRFIETDGTNNNTAIGFATAASAGALSEKVRIHPSGVASFNNGIELGSGLDATAANTLDDYEEGIWTPDLRNGTTSLSTQTWQHGPRATYTKVGDMVFIHLSGKLSSVGGTGGSELRIFGLPFPPETTGGYQEYRMNFILGNSVHSSDSATCFAFVRNGGQDFGCRIANGGDTVFTSNRIDSDTFFSIFGCYKT